MFVLHGRFRAINRTAPDSAQELSTAAKKSCVPGSRKVPKAHLFQIGVLASRLIHPITPQDEPGSNLLAAWYSAPGKPRKRCLTEERKKSVENRLVFRAQGVDTDLAVICNMQRIGGQVTKMFGGVMENLDNCDARVSRIDRDDSFGTVEPAVLNSRGMVPSHGICVLACGRRALAGVL